MGFGDGDGQGVSRALAVLGARAAGEDLCAASLCHRVGLLLDDVGELAAAEALHRRAGTLLASFPTGGAIDRERPLWARAMAANLVAQARLADAETVLIAAVVLASSLLGPDDPDTTAARRELEGIRAHADGGDREPAL